VWHDAEVTYAVAAPTSTFGSLPESYNIIHATLAAALRRLGVDALLAAPQRSHAVQLDGGACFATPVGGEVITDRGKLVGSAQVRDRGAFLQHGSILLDDRQDVVTRVTRGQSARPAATSLSAVLGRSVAFEEVVDVIVAQATADWGGDWQDGEADPLGIDVGRFGDPAWTWRR